MKKIVVAGSVVLVAIAFFILEINIPARNQNHAVEKIRAEENFENGDIIFQTSLSGQSDAIQLATHSKYSHCGIIFWEDGQCFVAEAGKQVTLTPIENFIKRGKNKHFVVKRLKNSNEVFTKPEILGKMATLFRDRFSGKPYDLYFEWSDDKIYCSELVWKLYKETVNIEIGELQRLGDFDLSSDVVKEKMKERYKGTIPLDEKVISPARMFESDRLITVLEK
jgi:hypothetical protein